MNPAPQDYHHLESNRALLHPPSGPPQSENMVLSRIIVWIPGSNDIHVHVHDIVHVIPVYSLLHDCIYMHVALTDVKNTKSV